MSKGMVKFIGNVFGLAVASQVISWVVFTKTSIEFLIKMMNFFGYVSEPSINTVTELLILFGGEVVIVLVFTYLAWAQGPTPLGQKIGIIFLAAAVLAGMTAFYRFVTGVAPFNGEVLYNSLVHFVFPCFILLFIMKIQNSKASQTTPSSHGGNNDDPFE